MYKKSFFSIITIFFIVSLLNLLIMPTLIKAKELEIKTKESEVPIKESETPIKESRDEIIDYFQMSEIPTMPILNKIQNTFQTIINQIINQASKTIGLQIEKEAQKEVSKQKKDFLKTFYGIINNIKFQIENIKQGIKRILGEIRSILFPSPKI